MEQEAQSEEMTPNKNRFRAWDEKHCEMVSWEELTSPSGWNCTLGVLTNQAAHHLKFMQSTGLADKNGTEIFEGDIIKWEYTEVIGNIHEHPELIDPDFSLYDDEEPKS